jgi:hypothetical protein
MDLTQSLEIAQPTFPVQTLILTSQELVHLVQLVMEGVFSVLITLESASFMKNSSGSRVLLEEQFLLINVFQELTKKQVLQISVLLAHQLAKIAQLAQLAIQEDVTRVIH